MFENRKRKEKLNKGVALMPNDFCKYVIENLNNGYYKKNIEEFTKKDGPKVISYIERKMVSIKYTHEYLNASDMFVKKLMK